jgi:hypothetical protein
VQRSIAVNRSSTSYFTGKLLEATSFALDQSYFRGRHEQRSATGVWLELDTGAGFEPWHEMPDFACSQRRDRHFILDRETGVLRFGDGERGLVPPVGACVRGWYRVGAGASGNLALSRSELITRLAEVSHFSWMRQAARDKQDVVYRELDPRPTQHDRERAKDALSELERVGLRVRCAEREFSPLRQAGKPCLRPQLI